MVGKVIKQLSLLGILCMGFMCGYSDAGINKLDRVDIDISIDSNGTAYIREVLNTRIVSGAEGIKQLRGLNGSELKSFKVTDEQGNEYKLDTPWDSKRNRLEKYHSNGYIQRLNGDIDLYWGLGDYGQRAYILEYVIADYIKGCKDGEFMYGNLVGEGGDYYPSKVDLDITFPSNIDLSGIQIKYYGFKGKSEVDNNSIHIETADMTTNESTYMTLLIYLGKENQFKDAHTFGKGFKELVEIADTSGGKELDIKTLSLGEIVIKMIPIILVVLLILVMRVIMVVVGGIANPRGLVVRVRYDKDAVEVDRVEAGDGLDIGRYELMGVSLQYGIMRSKYTIISGILAKWLLDENIDIRVSSGNIVIQFMKELHTADVYEGELYEMLIRASLYEYARKLKDKAIEVEDETDGLKDRLLIESERIVSMLENYTTDNEVDISKLELSVSGLGEWLRWHKDGVDNLIDGMILNSADVCREQGLLEEVEDSILVRWYTANRFKTYLAKPKFKELAGKIQSYIQHLVTGYTGDGDRLGIDLCNALTLGCSGEFIREAERRGFEVYTEPSMAKKLVAIERLTNMIEHRAMGRDIVKDKIRLLDK